LAECLLPKPAGLSAVARTGPYVPSQERAALLMWQPVVRRDARARDLHPGKGGMTMKVNVKTHVIRAVLALAAVASSALVLEAAKRWN
jgi:hypothetical protein